MKRLLTILFILLLTIPAYAGDWERVCGLLMVSPKDVQKPRIQVVTHDYYRIRCAPGGDAEACYDWISNTVYVTQENLHNRGVLLHEYAHAVMFQSAYQEMMAQHVEEMLR